MRSPGAFVDEDFTDVARKTGFLSVDFICTTEYDATLPNVTVASPHQKLVNTFGEYISNLGLTQLRIAETEKYAHVTFLLQRRRGAGLSPGEDRCLIPSPQGGHLRPAAGRCPPIRSRRRAVKRIESGAYDVIILNFANCDMVGHTGVYEACLQGRLHRGRVRQPCGGRPLSQNGRRVPSSPADHGRRRAYDRR